ncbi:hypothetical protein [Dickeya dianthicola]|uniref:hypothetical protein n=2 Tax=Dickeya dianthicola TaxID=204039 RepID=UPI001867F216|nr:hypothetical protein [Dickeya dianthicola]QOL16438.1 hypothetical protein HGI48_20915 [Dickeya dianthicola]
MSLLKKIKMAIGLEKQEIFRRWSAYELEEKKFYLEKKPPEEFTAEDHYLAAEWVIQRYLPEDSVPTPEQWSKSISDIRNKIDINLKKAAKGELVKNDPIQIEPYALTKEDFQKDIVPLFSKFDLLPDPFLKDSKGKTIWEVLFEFTQPYSYKHGEAKDVLILFCDIYSVEKLIQDIERTYTAIRKAKLDGSAKMKVVCNGKQCPDCMALDGKKLTVEELLDSFRSGNPLFPHQLIIDDVQSWCPPPYLSPEPPLREGDDPEFHSWLLKHFEGEN